MLNLRLESILCLSWTTSVLVRLRQDGMSLRNSKLPSHWQSSKILKLVLKCESSFWVSRWRWSIIDNRWNCFSGLRCLQSEPPSLQITSRGTTTHGDKNVGEEQGWERVALKKCMRPPLADLQPCKSSLIDSEGKHLRLYTSVLAWVLFDGNHGISIGVMFTENILRTSSQQASRYIY